MARSAAVGYARSGATLIGPAAAMAGYWPAAILIAYAMLAVVAVRLHEFIPGASVAKPVLLISVGGTLLLVSRTASGVVQDALQDRIGRLVVLYFAWITVTIPFAMWQALAFNTWQGVLPSVLLFFAIVLCPPSRRSLDRLQVAFVLMVLTYASYAQLFGSSWGGRLRIGGMYDSNDMASLMALAFPISAGLLARSVPGRARIAAIAAVLALGLGIIATGSRGGVLALLAGALVFALGFRGTRGVVVTAALVALGFVGWVNASPDFRARMMTLTSLEDDYNYSADTGRKAVWARGRGYIRDYPLFGVGAGNFPIAEGGMWEAQGQTGKWSAAHNAYIQAYAELGLFGGSVFVAMLLVGAHRAARLWRVAHARGRAPPLDRPELLGGLAAFAAGGYFLSHAFFPPAFGLLGLITLAERVRVREAAGTAPLVPGPPIVQPGERGGMAFRSRRLPQAHRV